MKEGLKTFVFVIVIPALGLALGGLRLLSVEADNAQKIGKEALRAKAEQVAAHVHGRLRRPVEEAFSQVANLPRTNKVVLASLAARIPLVKEIRRRQRGKEGFLVRGGMAILLDREAVLARVPDWILETWDAPTGAEQSETAMTLALRDKDGHVIHQLPGYKRTLFSVGVPLAEVPGVRVCVAWRDAAFRTDRMRTRIYLIGAVVILLLVTSLFGGTWMLVRSARAARREARRQLDFTAGVSHEFKTPITAILLATEFAESRAETPELRQALADIAEESRKLSHLVSDVLDAARFSDDRRLPVDPTDVGDGIQAWANRPALDHLLGNLRENAVKYAGGAPEERVRTDGDRVFIDVMDRGPGLAEEDLRHMFEMYWRGDRSVARKTGGCGLGLPIARCLARMQGGELSVARREGGGLVFTVMLKKVEEKDG